MAHSVVSEITCGKFDKNDVHYLKLKFLTDTFKMLAQHMNLLNPTLAIAPRKALKPVFVLT